MGTSNWQNIAFNVEILMKIEPKRVLDVGVGFGRWGMVVREFCDVWFGRISPDDWQVEIDGIEAFAQNIRDYHKTFYNRVHIADAREAIYRLQPPWDVVLFGDVLEHFEKPKAEELLQYCLDNSAYVIVNIPLGAGWPQDEIYENPFERHLSSWSEEEFQSYSLVRSAKFLDYIGRPFGVFVLSKDDPKNVKEKLFSQFSSQIQAENGSIDRTADEFIKALEMKNDQLNHQLLEIRSSLGFRLLEKTRRLPGFAAASRLTRRLIHSVRRNTPSVGHPAEPESSKLVEPEANKISVYPAPKQPGDAGELWLNNLSHPHYPLTVLNPEWRGVRSSAMQLFDNFLMIPDNLDEQSAQYYAGLIVKANPPSITIQGFPLTYYWLVKALRKTAPSIPIYVIWHGNFLHNVEDYAWRGLNLIKELAAAGDLKKVGFVKKGMAEVMRTAGMNTFFVMNYVRRIPDAPSQPLTAEPQIGIWGEQDFRWQKLPYAMLAALSLVPNARAQVINVSARAVEFGKWFPYQAKYQTRAISHEQVVKTLAEMHLNLYVTLSECAPMLPLESLSLGVPCLFGPVSHYFLDHPYLRERLVVPYPEHAEVIAGNAVRALAERDQIIDAYRQFAAEYNRRAVQVLSEFLEYPMPTPPEQPTQ